MVDGAIIADINIILRATTPEGKLVATVSLAVEIMSTSKKIFIERKNVRLQGYTTLSRCVSHTIRDMTNELERKLTGTTPKGLLVRRILSEVGIRWSKIPVPTI